MSDGKDKLVQAELKAIIDRGGWRAGVLLVTTAGQSGAREESRLISAAIVQHHMEGVAADLINVPRRLRQIADEIDAVVLGARALPEQK